ncbi:MAG: replication-associated recombination protein A [Flavobacteriales bacterium]|nr:replication-associated recombination protein A [Flavobacteriales bacterium]
MTDLRPLAERLRPKRISEVIGQEHLLGAKGAIFHFIRTSNLPSLIFWGPPGVGKTTLAEVIAEEVDRPFQKLSAINAGVRDVRDIINKAKNNGLFAGTRPILFIDEIHRFSKSQQDSLLEAVEKGTITLIGATTENPSFEVISALLSRCQVYTLKPLDSSGMDSLLERAVKEDSELSKKNISLHETESLKRISGGDGRKLLNAIELVVQMTEGDSIIIKDDLVNKIIKENLALYDKGGEQHYDIISAFIKSVRGSDPQAAVYWLARMVAGGEDPKFIARRLLILASEDIGLANPNALLLAESCFQAVERIGWPESRIILSQCTLYLANSPKSNSAYLAINEAMQEVKLSGDLPVPLALRNAPTSLMKDLDYGKGYKYSHDSEGSFSFQDFLPEGLKKNKYYDPGENAQEKKVRERLISLWKSKYDY